MKHLYRLLLATLVPLTTATVMAGWMDWLPKSSDTNHPSSGASPVAALTQDEIAKGLREALSKGVQHAVTELGKEDGFLKNLDVKIPMPESMQKVEKTLRSLKQDKYADEFVTTMNHAAEKAVTEASTVFADSLSKMTLDDAQNILHGADDAATQYFRKTSEAQLREKFLPIVKKATESTGVTSAYKNLMAEAGPMAQFLGHDAGDIDGYVTQKSLDGLFKMIATEEEKIRQDPVARSTDLLKKVFGSTGK